MTPIRIARLIAWAMVLVFAVLALALGKDQAWDFRNYHWYNPYAYLNGRLGFDSEPGHGASFFNPILDIPFYLLATNAPGWVVGLVLGAVHGVNFGLLFEIALAALRAGFGRLRPWAALGLATSGMAGGMAFGMTGLVYHDNVVSIPVLLACLLLIWAAQKSEGREGSAADLRAIAYAGIAGGAAVGMKLTSVPHAAALIVAVLALRATWRVRGMRVAALGVGGGIGFLLFGGFWAWTLWREMGNPIFPYFNNIFGSPMGSLSSNRDMDFVPTSIGEALIFPFLFSFDSKHVAEFVYRDIKIMLAYVLTPVTLALVLSRWTSPSPLMAAPATRVIIAYAAASYLVWLVLFSIYRYAIALEMLAPVMIVALISLWPMKLGWRLSFIGLLLIGAAGTTQWKDLAFDRYFRAPWAGTYVKVGVPPVADPQATIALMTGIEPLAYLIPFFPPEIRFLRIEGFGAKPDLNNGIMRRNRERIANHQGPMFALLGLGEVERARAAYAKLNLAIVGDKCFRVATDVPQPIAAWCPLKRTGAPVPP